MNLQDPRDPNRSHRAGLPVAVRRVTQAALDDIEFCTGLKQFDRLIHSSTGHPDRLIYLGRTWTGGLRRGLDATR